MSYIDVKTHSGDIICWYRDSEDKLRKHVEPISDYYYFYIPSPKASANTYSLFDEPVKKVHFADYNSYDLSREKYKITYESDIPAYSKFLSDNFYKNNKGTLHVGLFDIEADFDLSNGRGYPTPDNPHGKINSISLFDRYNQTYHMIMLTDDDSIEFEDEEDGLPIEFYYCKNERDVTDVFIYLIRDIDILSAWNGDGYDILYLIERFKILYGEETAMKLLCRDNFRVYEKDTFDDFGNQTKEYRLTGRHHLDAMSLYKKYTFEEKGSYRLDNIAEIELEKKKNEYEGDLGQLYRDNPYEFFLYSFQDTRLLKQLDESLNHINIAVSMCQDATCKYTDIFGSIKSIEGAIRNYCHYDKNICLVLPDKKDNQKQKFPGAIVLSTRTGVYGWSMSIDLTSLYPSVIRSLNMSPETYIMQCIEYHDDFVKITNRTNDIIDVRVLEDNEIISMEAHELNDFLKENHYTISANGSIFHTNKVGIIPEFLAKNFFERKEMKKKMKEATTTEEEKYYDMLQHIKKIYLNSLYGAISNEYSRFFDINIASSVTLTGQEIEKFQTYMVNRVIDQYEIPDSI